MLGGPALNTTNQTRVALLVEQASQLQQSGQDDAALSRWQEVLQLQPKHPVAATNLGLHALSRGDLAAAEQLLETAVAADPNLAFAHAAMSRLRAAQGRPEAALAAITAAVKAEPTAWGALLEQARLLEAAGDARGAAMAWGNALAYIPDAARRAPQLQELVKRAEAAVEANRQRLYEHLHARLQPLLGAHERKALRRFEECLNVVSGRRPFVTARPLMLPFPHLPAIPWFERDEFPWVPEVEAFFPVMLEELHGVLEADTGFIPYVRTRAGEASNQFAALDYNPDWSAYFLWNDGQRVDENADRCPQTEKALTLAPQNKVPGRAPVAFYSALKPGTHIAAHNGATNTRLTVHMPLIIPPECGALRVGGEARTWEPGKLMIFDDTIRHEAWNHSDQLRVVLIFDIWNPFLTPLEQELVSQTVQGMVDYYGDNADLGEL